MKYPKEERFYGYKEGGARIYPTKDQDGTDVIALWLARGSTYLDGPTCFDRKTALLIADTMHSLADPDGKIREVYLARAVAIIEEFVYGFVAGGTIAKARQLLQDLMQQATRRTMLLDGPVNFPSVKVEDKVFRHQTGTGDNDEQLGNG